MIKLTDEEARTAYDAIDYGLLHHDWGDNWESVYHLFLKLQQHLDINEE